jgi:predicted alpha/beta-fold hydrolase
VTLTGDLGSHESYVRAVLAPACAPVDAGGLGYRGVVVNFRGCECIMYSGVKIRDNLHVGAGVPITSPQLDSAGHTDDLRQALFFISKLYPRAPLLGLGFSLGANVMTRYIAEEGEGSRLVAGCALGCVRILGHFHYTSCLTKTCSHGTWPKTMTRKAHPINTLNLNFLVQFE